MQHFLHGGERNFYPRPPRGGRQVYDEIYISVYEFLATPSARRATVQLIFPGKPDDISIHALREEGDVASSSSTSVSKSFLSTPSARRAT